MSKFEQVPASRLSLFIIVLIPSYDRVEPLSDVMSRSVCFGCQVCIRNFQFPSLFEQEWHDLDDGLRVTEDTMPAVKDQRVQVTSLYCTGKPYCTMPVRGSSHPTMFHPNILVTLHKIGTRKSSLKTLNEYSAMFIASQAMCLDYV